MTIPMSRALRVLAVPAFKDNYLWLIHDGVHAAVVDPGDAAPIFQALAAHHLTLSAILLTHHHADHIGGVPALLARHPVPVFGPSDARIATVTCVVAEGDSVQVPGLDLSLRVLDVPGHTISHIAYLRDEADAPWLFCGDTLFAGGCGRLFDGSAAQLRNSLDRLAGLADQTVVYCAHEYTLSNLRFALAVEPGNRALQQRVETETAKRAADLPTVPTSIGLEKATNPFLRYRQAEIAGSLLAAGKIAPDADPATLFAALREWKNNF